MIIYRKVKKFVAYGGLMFTKLKIKIALLCSFTFVNSYADYKAVIKVPIADATSKSLASLNIADSPQKVYQEMPFSPKSDNSCYRAHQLLFNQIVNVKSELEEEIECEVDDTFYIENGNKNSTFWTLKNNIKNIDDIKNAANSIPINNKNNTLTLIYPWFEPKMDMYFSAGTKLLRQKSLDTPNALGAKALNFKNNKVTTFKIPKKYVVTKDDLNDKDLRKEFIKILHLWSHQSPLKIPYVWGGSSFIETYKSSNFKLDSKLVNDKKVEFWARPDCTSPHSGFDCSSLIRLAAQICNINFPYKNTNTMAQYLRPLDENEKIEEGDLIWIPNHIMVISNIEKGKIIEARGYTSGYGSVHEIPLHKQFLNVKDIENLSELYNKKQPLSLLNSKGEIEREETSFKILKLPSN